MTDQSPCLVCAYFRDVLSFPVLRQSSPPSAVPPAKPSGITSAVTAGMERKVYTTCRAFPSHINRCLRQLCDHLSTAVLQMLPSILLGYSKDGLFTKRRTRSRASGPLLTRQENNSAARALRRNRARRPRQMLGVRLVLASLGLLVWWADPWM